MSLTESIAQAIAQMEGFFKPGTIAQRQNNPGNLRSWGNRPVVSGYAVFDTPDAGWQALYQQVDKNIGRGLTLQEFFGGKPGVYGGYSPSADNNRPVEYAAFVAGRAGIDANTPLNQVSETTSAESTGQPGPSDDSSSSEAGSVDWDTVASTVTVVGIVLVAIWWAFRD